MPTDTSLHTSMYGYAIVPWSIICAAVISACLASRSRRFCAAQKKTSTVESRPENAARSESADLQLCVERPGFVRVGAGEDVEPIEGDDDGVLAESVPRNLDPAAPKEARVHRDVELGRVEHLGVELKVLEHHFPVPDPELKLLAVEVFDILTQVRGEYVSD